MTEFSFEDILVEGPDEHGVLGITLNRPDRLNASTPRMTEELMAVARWLRTEQGVGAVLLTGAGRAFSAGADMRNMDSFTEDEYRLRVMELGAHVVQDLLRIKPPVVVAINGPAVGWGARTALAGDVVFMADTAVICDPHVRSGIVAGDGGALFWPALLGPSRAKEFLFTGDPMDGVTAARYGLVNHVVPKDELIEVATEYARRLAAGARHAIAWTKQLINISLLREADWMMPLGNAQEARTQAMPDFVEGVEAFFQKRQPMFPSTQTQSSEFDSSPKPSVQKVDP